VDFLQSWYLLRKHGGKTGEELKAEGKWKTPPNTGSHLATIWRNKILA